MAVVLPVPINDKHHNHIAKTWNTLTITDHIISHYTISCHNISTMQKRSQK
jgi:hypothetical protein